MQIKKADLEYFNRGFGEAEKFLNRFIPPLVIDGQTILDVGCGHGTLCVCLAKAGARKVVGVDTDTRRIEFARNNLSMNYPELMDKIEFMDIDLKDLNDSDIFDYVVSKDTFEHIIDLRSMMGEIKRVLKPGGSAYIGFGPLYRDFYGDHKRTKSIIPWGHLMRSEKSIVESLNRKNRRREGRKISSIYDLGLNKLSLAEYKAIFRESGMETLFFRLNNSKHPILRLFNLLAKIPFLTEYFSHNLYCILQNGLMDTTKNVRK